MVVAALLMFFFNLWLRFNTIINWINSYNILVLQFSTWWIINSNIFKRDCSSSLKKLSTPCLSSTLDCFLVYQPLFPKKRLSRTSMSCNFRISSTKWHFYLRKKINKEIRRLYLKLVIGVLYCRKKHIADQKLNQIAER